MLTTVVARRDITDLALTVDIYLRDGWKIQGGLAYGDGVWAVLLVKEEKAGLQYPYRPERTMAYQEVAKSVSLQR